MKHGAIVTGSSLMLGPDIGDGSFKATAIKSIHYKRLPVQRVWLIWYSAYFAFCTASHAFHHGNGLCSFIDTGLF